ncbi:MAG: hypothetical protein SFX74_01360 [Fimbriimonadaceae bacterium]|nr:hypothetical protein [Fimbriimonadaceae bacterium]
MKRIPEEIDSLMWGIAESGDPSAVDQFAVRYPQYEAEMRKRIALVSGFKRAKPKTDPVRSVPKFSPRREIAEPRASWTPAAWAIGLSLAALGVASFTAFSLFGPKPTRDRPPVVADQGNQPEVKPWGSNPRPDVAPPISPVDGMRTEPNPRDVPPLRTGEPAYLRPTSVHIAKAKLADALALIGAQSGLEVVVAPGFPDVEVTVDYDGLSAIQILQELGRDYGFTAFDQGNGSVIAVPATDPEDGGGADAGESEDATAPSDLTVERPKRNP